MQVPVKVQTSYIFVNILAVYIAALLHEYSRIMENK